MFHPITISSRGKAGIGLNPNIFSAKHLKEVCKMIDSYRISKQTIMIMSEADWNDIKSWGEST
jgi:hypothetical protein